MQRLIKIYGLCQDVYSNVTRARLCIRIHVSQRQPENMKMLCLVSLLCLYVCANALANVCSQPARIGRYRNIEVMLCAAHMQDDVKRAPSSELHKLRFHSPDL